MAQSRIRRSDFCVWNLPILSLLKIGKISKPSKLIKNPKSLTNGRGSWVAGCESKVAVAVAGLKSRSPMSQSLVQCRCHWSNVEAGANDLEFEITEWKRLIWKQYKGKKSFLWTILYGSQFTGYGCWSQQNNVSRKDLKEKAGVLLCSPQVYFVLFLSGPVMGKFSFEYTCA